MSERSPESVTVLRYIRRHFVRIVIGTVMMAAVYGAMLVWMPYQRELRIARKIEAVGGRVSWGYFGPTWFPRSIQNTPLFFDRIDSVGLPGKVVTSDLISNIATLTNLRSLGLNNTQVTDEGLKHLNGMVNLQNLLLEQTQATDAGLEHLKGLTSLKLLNLKGTKTTPSGRAMLRKPSCIILPFDPPDPPQIMDPEWYHRHQQTIFNTECQR